MPIFMFFYRLSLMTKGIQVGRSVYVKGVDFKGKARIEDRCRLSGQPKISVGKNFYLNVGCHLLGDITIGDNVIVGPQVVFWGRDHGLKKGLLINQQVSESEPIKVGNDVWIGSHATILKGVTIGNGAVVAAGAVVNKDVKENEIVGGIPAKKISERK